ncbi:MAG: ATPase, T2SS/T4P/T4SS family, partial [Bacilli bacterium]|nr:ATPase, T2SS/T4P/T4SS family [Bacilli bacterium]
MAKKKFVDEFKVNVKEEVVETIGYEIFSNKQLLEELRNKIIQNLIDNNKISKDINEYIKEEINKTLEGYNLTIVERNYVYDLIVNEITGYGPITELLNDDNVTEIMVNGPNNVYVEIDGKIFKENEISFINDEHVIRTVQRMIGPLGKTIDAANPMVDARLKDGSRINAIIEPLSTKGPILTIRKFKSEIDEIEDLLKNGTMT